MPSENETYVKIVRNYHLLGYIRKFLIVFLAFCFQDMPVAALFSFIFI
jgi:hypothetical protein